MHLVDDHGRTVDAEYHVEADGGHLALIMESRSGISGRRAPRNPGYNRVLTILLARLGRLNAVLVDAVVDSRRTQDLGLPEADRRLIQAPLQLALEPDADALRRRLGTAQAKVAQAPNRLREPDRQNVVVVDTSSAGDADAGEQGHHLQAERFVVPVDVGPVAGSPADTRVGDAGQQRRDNLVPEGEQGADDAGGTG